MNNLQELKDCLSKAEVKFQGLKEQLNSLNNSANEQFYGDKLSELKIENNKLKYRMDILKRSIEEEEGLMNKVKSPLKDQSNDLGYLMKSLHSSLKDLFESAIKSSYPELKNPPIPISPSSHADYQCNSALQLAKLLKDKVSGKITPRDIADKIICNIPKNEILSSVEIAGAGFINIKINREFICKEVRNVALHGVQMQNRDGKLKRILVDMSAPNIAKEMHVGHLRSTIIGDCISNVFEFLGNEVLKVNHVGDWGTQFGMLLAHLTEKFPDFMNNPPPIGDLQTFYKEAKKRFDNEEEFKKRAYSCVVKLQAKEHNMYTAWTQICDISRKEFNLIYEMLNIKNLKEKGESFYNDLMRDIVAELEEKNLLEEDEGRKIMFSRTPSKPPLTIVKSDGGFTYDTSDMAALKYRAQEEKADRIIVVTDAGQATHFEVLYDCGLQAGLYDPKKCNPQWCGFGVVLGEDKKKFKTRSGETIRLMDLLNEGYERSLNKLIEKGRDKELSPEELEKAKKVVAIGCIKYSDLKHDRNNDYEFSFNRMLDDRGNTAVYLLYSLTRIHSIIRIAQEEITTNTVARDIGENLQLNHPREVKLGKYILQFPEVIYQLADDLYPHSLCQYLYNLSVTFCEFYDQCYVIEKVQKAGGELGKKVNQNRLILCQATAAVITKGLNLLGIEALSRM